MELGSDEAVLSVALPLRPCDPLKVLPIISDDQQFRFFWDTPKNFCFAAAGKCNHLDLSGKRRFELVQKFSSLTLTRLLDATPNAPSEITPKILFAFSFFEQASERYMSPLSLPGVQAVLPRWQFVRTNHSSWLRLNGIASQISDLREIVEKLWLMRQKIISLSSQLTIKGSNLKSIENTSQWTKYYEKALLNGINLVENGELDKLVLAVRKNIILEEDVNPLYVIDRLRKHQKLSCKFLWQRSDDDIFFGASPERLFSLKGNLLQSDALAGTSNINNTMSLLNSDKDLREHKFVVESISKQFKLLGLYPEQPGKPRLERFGNLEHLYTPIISRNCNIKPIKILSRLHPTPAVSGSPRKSATSCLRSLEPFERGNYASPIGWLDNLGNADFRVAIRSGNLKGRNLELTAGAGLVKGSIVENELAEVELKFGVLADQFQLHPKILSSDLII
tara:strand:+ start:522 stop:1871 length:1350 start_codon:yes stop_codon:yes gene_type:complete